MTFGRKSEIIAAEIPKLITEALEELLDIIKNFDPQIISVDGESLAGKSSFVSETIVHQLGYEYIDVDDFTSGSGGKYSLDLDKLKNKLKQAEEKKVLIDGVTLLNVLNKIHVKPDLKVYVKRCNKHGTWVHWKRESWSTEDIYSSERSKEEVIEDYSDSPVREEIMEYHFEKKPHENADIIFLNIDQSIT